MLIFTWILQIVLGIVFLGAGYLKATKPYMELAADPNMGWVESFTPNTVRTIGILEFFAGVGILFPHMVDLFTWLTPLAALGLMATMIGAAGVHLRRGEFQPIAINILFFILACLVFYLRLVYFR
ncbi:MAG TPA: DoxX family protein [Anaerolineae bacterium]|nr:DoxX family protein [Anaerolineae bacterium]